MGFLDFAKKQFIDVIEWLPASDDLVMAMYPATDREIQNGGILTVRESQAALFVNEGKAADVFMAGRHTLNTKTLPILTNLKNWDKAFASPFKSDVFFFALKQFLDLRWGTQQPITINDPELGLLRIRAFGNYSVGVIDPKLLFTSVAGVRSTMSIGDLEAQLTSSIIMAFPAAILASKKPFTQLAAEQQNLSSALQTTVNPIFAQMGLKLYSLNVMSLSLPEDVQEHMDRAAGMRVVGDLNKYTQFQTAEAIGKAGDHKGQGNLGADIASGLAIGQAMLGQMGNASSAAKSGESDAFAMLEKLHDMLKKGILTQQEFDTKKADILKRMGG